MGTSNATTQMSNYARPTSISSAKSNTSGGSSKTKKIGGTSLSRTKTLSNITNIEATKQRKMKSPSVTKLTLNENKGSS
jgi:hypothetical protein